MEICFRGGRNEDATIHFITREGNSIKYLSDAVKEVQIDAMLGIVTFLLNPTEHDEKSIHRLEEIDIKISAHQGEYTKIHMQTIYPLRIDSNMLMVSFKNIRVSK